MKANTDFKVVTITNNKFFTMIQNFKFDKVGSSITSIIDDS